jgi:hypothetical protein
MIFLLFITAFLCERLFVLAQTRHDAMIYHAIGLHVIIMFICYYFFSSIPYKEIEKKLAAALFFIYRLLAFIFYSYCQLSTVHTETTFQQNKFAATGLLKIAQDLFIPIIILYFIYLIYIKLKKFNFKNSDYPNQENMLILFRYPKDIIGLFLTLLWKYPANTVSLYSNGFKYGFVRKTRTLIKCKIDHSQLLSGKYFIVDTKKPKQDLSRYIGIRWNFNRNCFNVFHPVIGDLGNYI